MILTSEICSQTEIYLPVSEIRSAFGHLLRRSIRYEPFLPAFTLFSAQSWPDALEKFNRALPSANPAELIRGLAADEDRRRVFIASSLVPCRYGGEFGRYPRQAGFLKEWLTRRRQQGFAGVALLDAACGSGELSYELAELLRDTGWEPAGCTVVGETIEPLELVAAAHGWFPHDRVREAGFRRRAEPILASGGADVISFVSRDVRYRDATGKRYDVVVCNGLIGGPFLHDAARIREVVQCLAKRVGKGGLLLAADRFHGGWRKSVPVSFIRSTVEAAGFSMVDIGEGVAAVRL